MRNMSLPAHHHQISQLSTTCTHATLIWATTNRGVICLDWTISRISDQMSTAVDLWISIFLTDLLGDTSSIYVLALRNMKAQTATIYPHDHRYDII